MTSAIGIFQFSQMTGALVRRTIGPAYFCPAHFCPAYFCPAYFCFFEAKMSTGLHFTLVAVAAEVDHDASNSNSIRTLIETTSLPTQNRTLNRKRLTAE